MFLDVIIRPTSRYERRIPLKIIRRFLLIGACLVLLCVAGYSGYRVYTIQHGYSEAKQIYDGISQEYVCYDDNSTEPDTEEIKNNSVAMESSPVKVDFVDLRKNLNPEICAWIWSQDTVINYPVVQHSDNEHYLNYNVNGEASANGAIFLEAANFNDFRDTNNILHGHHMGDGSMFASLDCWQVTDYLEEHPVMYLNTPSCNYRVDLFAGFTTPAHSKAYQYEFSSISEINVWIDWVRNESVIHPEIDLSPHDRFLTLSTCAYSYEDARTVLIGRLTPIE